MRDSHRRRGRNLLARGEAYALATLLALIIVYAGLSIYFASVKTKLENIAEFKARHGIPSGSPHKVDEILKEGFFLAP